MFPGTTTAIDVTGRQNGWSRVSGISRNAGGDHHQTHDVINSFRFKNDVIETELSLSKTPFYATI